MSNNKEINTPTATAHMRPMRGRPRKRRSAQSHLGQGNTRKLRSFYMSDAQYDRLKTQAKQAGLSISAYIAWLVDHAELTQEADPQTLPFTVEDAIAYGHAANAIALQLHGIARNINQATRWSHANQQLAPDYPKLAAKVKDIAYAYARIAQIFLAQADKPYRS